MFRRFILTYIFKFLSFFVCFNYQKGYSVWHPGSIIKGRQSVCQLLVRQKEGFHRNFPVGPAEWFGRAHVWSTMFPFDCHKKSENK